MCSLSLALYSTSCLSSVANAGCLSTRCCLLHTELCTNKNARNAAKAKAKAKKDRLAKLLRARKVALAKAEKARAARARQLALHRLKAAQKKKASLKKLKKASKCPAFTHQHCRKLLQHFIPISARPSSACAAKTKAFLRFELKCFFVQGNTSNPHIHCNSVLFNRRCPNRKNFKIARATCIKSIHAAVKVHKIKRRC